MCCRAPGVARAAEEAFLQSLRQPPLGQEEQDAAAAAAGGAGGGQPWVALLHPVHPRLPLFYFASTIPVQKPQTAGLLPGAVTHTVTTFLMSF